MTGLWQNIKADDASGKWHLAQALIEGEKAVWATKGDQLECGWTGCRKKAIHSVGVVGKLDFKVTANDNPYTGIFATGSDKAFVRFSKATDSDPLAPGMGVKFLRDGIDSGNFVAMYSVGGQESNNFFENDWHNHVPSVSSASLYPLELKFYAETYYI